jgi:hypothetical protein
MAPKAKAKAKTKARAKAKAKSRSGTGWAVRYSRQLALTLAAEALATTATARATAAETRAAAAEACVAELQQQPPQQPEQVSAPSAAQLLTVLGDMGRDQASIVVTRLKALHKL